MLRSSLRGRRLSRARWTTSSTPRRAWCQCPLWSCLKRPSFPSTAACPTRTGPQITLPSWQSSSMFTRRLPGGAPATPAMCKKFAAHTASGGNAMQAQHWRAIQGRSELSATSAMSSHRVSVSFLTISLFFLSCQNCGRGRDSLHGKRSLDKHKQRHPREISFTAIVGQ